MPTLDHDGPKFIQPAEAYQAKNITASQSLWTTVVQSLVAISRDHADVNPVRFPNMRGAYDFNRDDKGGKPSREPGAHCDIQMGNYNHITKESSLRKNCSVMRTVPLAARRYLKTQCSCRLTKNIHFFHAKE